MRIGNARADLDQGKRKERQQRAGKAKATRPELARQHMHKFSFLALMAGITLGAGTLATLGSKYVTQQARSIDQSSYSLVMEYQGNAFVLDQDLSVGDCFEAMPVSQTAKGLHFACEQEG